MSPNLVSAGEFFPDFLPDSVNCSIFLLLSAFSSSFLISDNMFLQFAKESMLSWGVKRKREFFAGRLALQQLLCSAGETNSVVSRGENGEPVFSSKWSGSVSHSHETVFAGICSHGWMGVDCERKVSAETLRRVKKAICLDGELESIQGDEIELFTRIFSLKEAFYKAMFPDVRQYFGFEYARVSLECGQWKITLMKPLGEFKSGVEFRVFSRFLNGYAFSLCFRD